MWKLRHASLPESNRKIKHENNWLRIRPVIVFGVFDLTLLCLLALQTCGALFGTFWHSLRPLTRASGGKLVQEFSYLFTHSVHTIFICYLYSINAPFLEWRQCYRIYAEYWMLAMANIYLVRLWDGQFIMYVPSTTLTHIYIVPRNATDKTVRHGMD